VTVFFSSTPNPSSQEEGSLLVGAIIGLFYEVTVDLFVSILLFRFFFVSLQPETNKLGL